MLNCEIIPGPATNLMIWFSITPVSAVFSTSNATILCLSLNSANEKAEANKRAVLIGPDLIMIPI